MILHQLESCVKWGSEKKDVLFLILSGLALLASLFHVTTGTADPAWISIILCGIPIIWEAAAGLVTKFDIKADVLVSLALIASVIIGEIFAAGEIAWIMQISSLLEERTVAKARTGIENLVHLTPRTARRMSHGTEQLIPAEHVQSNRMHHYLCGSQHGGCRLPGLVRHAAAECCRHHCPHLQHKGNASTADWR